MVTDKQAEAAPRVDQALELVRCAQINLENMVKMMPVLARHPLLPMVRMQIEGAIAALGGNIR